MANLPAAATLFRVPATGGYLLEDGSAFNVLKRYMPNSCGFNKYIHKHWILTWHSLHIWHAQWLSCYISALEYTQLYLCVQKLMKEGMLLKFSRKEPQPRMFFLVSTTKPIPSYSIPHSHTPMFPFSHTTVQWHPDLCFFNPTHQYHI